MCCVLLERGVAGEKIQAAFLSSSALEVIYKTTVEHTEQWKLHQQMTTWLNSVSHREMCPVSLQTISRCPWCGAGGYRAPQDRAACSCPCGQPCGQLHRWLHPAEHSGSPERWGHVRPSLEDQEPLSEKAG